MRGWVNGLAVVLLSASLAFAAVPPNANIHALASSPSGVLYAAGAVDQTGFIAQLPDGYVYRTTAPVNALAVSADGSVFATGGAFVVKLGATGELEYARVLDGVSAQGLAIAVSSAGEALVSGTVTLKDDQAAAAFPTTPGAVMLRSVFNSGFLTKLDPSGKNIVVSILGYGGGPVGFDAAGNLYVTGQLQFANLTPTPGALQTQHDTFGCTGTSYVGSSCLYEYVAKISPDGTKLLYATYLTGQWGSVPTALFVDSAGNAIVAGTTPSHDFPVTPGAFQSENHGTDGPSVLYGFTGAHLPNIPPPTAGVISKVNPNGTALLWSTYFGGSGVETITGAQLDSAGDIVFTGLTGSPDLPGSAPLPSCLRFSRVWGPLSHRSISTESRAKFSIRGPIRSMSVCLRT